MNKRALPVIWVLAIGGIVMLGSIMHGETTYFFGIADNREQIISFPQPVEIVRTHVVEGESVDGDSLILEVRRHDLSSELAIIEHKLTELSAQNRESIATTRPELESLKAKQQAEIAELDAQVASLESRYTINVKLLREISGDAASERVTASSPLLVELRGLKKKRRHLAESRQARIDDLTARLNAEVRPADEQLAELEARKTELLRQATNLKVTARFDAKVGSILYRPGEQVPPFKPVLTLHSAVPQFIKGYIHEDVLNEARIGQPVWVQSRSGVEKETIRGEVESLGTRIVEYPDRLKKNRLVPAWGREVVVRIEPDNKLLLGEKVKVSMQPEETMGTVISGTADWIKKHFWVTDAVAAESHEAEPVASIARARRAAQSMVY